MDGKSRPGRAAPYDSQAASRRLSAALVVAPLLMAVHGVLLLRASDHGPLSWFLVAIAAVTGLIGTRFGNSERVVLGQALVLFGVAAWLMQATGGPQSFFLLWLFVIVSVYPALLPGAARLPLVGAVATFYLLSAVWSPDRLPTVVLVSRALLLLGIGTLITVTAGVRERLAVVDGRFRSLVDAANDAIPGVDGDLIYDRSRGDRRFRMTLPGRPAGSG